MHKILLNKEDIQNILNKRKSLLRIPLNIPRNIVKRKDVLIEIKKGKPLLVNFYYFVNLITKEKIQKDIILNYKTEDILWVEEPIEIDKINVKQKKIYYTYKTDKLGSICDLPVKYHEKNSKRFIKNMSRIFLTVSMVTIERVRDITISDVRKEGFKNIIEYKRYWDRRVKEKHQWSKNPFTLVFKINNIEIKNMNEYKKEEKIKYKCKNCGAITEDFIENILEREKKCYDCHSLDLKNKQKVKKNYPKKEHMVICDYCQTTFLTTGEAKYCSKECRQKGIEKKHFYRNLEMANKEIAVTKVRVFGQGRYETVNFTGDYKDNETKNR